MTTDDAFAGLVGNKYLWRATGLPDGLRRWYAHQLRHKQFVSLDVKTRLLNQAKFGHIPASWTLPNS
ncbi:hypothetical protein [Spirosoma litoris]